jgi:hypothetical protein
MTDITEAGKTGLTAPPPPQVPDAFRMAAEFAEPTVKVETQNPPTPETPPPSKFVREIDLKDGSGVQKFEADSWEGLVDKLATAQENATKKIRELSARKPIEPEREVKPAYEIKEPSAADMLALKEGFEADPAAAFKKAFELYTGQTPEQYQQERGQYLSEKQRKEAENAFLAAHKKDFVNNPENAQKIGEFLTKEQLPVTKKNLEYAFQNLQDDFVKPVQAPAVNLPPPPPVPTVRDIPPPPVTIPARFGDRPMDQNEPGGVNAAEMAQIAQLPPEQMKARIEKLFRKQRGLAG